MPLPFILIGAAAAATAIGAKKAYDGHQDKNLADDLIYAELSGDFPLGDSRQPTYKSLRPFDLVS